MFNGTYHQHMDFVPLLNHQFGARSGEVAIIFAPPEGFIQVRA